MGKKTISMLLSFILLFNLCWMNVFAANPVCNVSICGTSLDTSGSQSAVYYKFSNTSGNGVTYSKVNSSGNWNVCFEKKGSGESATRKLILKDLELNYKEASNPFIKIDDSAFSSNFVLEIQGNCVLTSLNSNEANMASFVKVYGSADVTCADGATLKLKGSNKGPVCGIANFATSTGKESTINFINADIEFTAPVEGYFTNADIINFNNSTITIDALRCYQGGMIRANKKVSVNSSSDLDILIGNDDDDYISANSSANYAISSSDISIDSSKVVVRIINSLADCYGISMPGSSYGNPGSEKLTVNSSTVTVNIKGISTYAIGMGATNLDIINSDCSVYVHGDFKHSFGIVAAGWNGYYNHTVNSDKGTSNITGSELSVMLDNIEPDNCYGLALEGKANLTSNSIELDVSSGDANGSAVYVGDISSTINNNDFDIILSTTSSVKNSPAFYFETTNDNGEVSFGNSGTINVISNNYAFGTTSGKKLKILFGEHMNLDVKAITAITSNGVTYSFADGKTRTPSNSGEYKAIEVTYHYFTGCTDDTCSYPECDFMRFDVGTHTFANGSDICSKCSFIKKVSIADLSAPVANSNLDTSATVQIAKATDINQKCVIKSIKWTQGGKEATKADYDSIYKVTIELSGVGNYWFNEDTLFDINGSTVKLIDDSHIEFTFPATAKKNPSSTDTPTVTTTPNTVVPTATTEPTPSANPTESPVVTSDVVPTAVPTEAPTATPTNAAKLDVGDFVKRCYKVALNRDADSEGYKYWVDNLNQGRACGAQVGFGFIFSQEYMNKARTNEEYVTDLYSMYFDREPDEFGFEYWVERLENGESREEIFAGFANSLEFYMLCVDYNVVAGYYVVGVPNDQQGGVNCFVARLYTICFDRLPDMGGHAGWVLKLINGEVSGSTAAYGFVFSPEFTNLKLDNTNFVKYMYRAFFGREADNGGLDYWVSQMEAGTASQTDVFNGFTGSAEFINLCASYGIQA
ncbi:MAG: DUF4214 domain-containing protein [Clostridia bacterium]|nr:DUF4214 domain-containing protein [Clostridia bacterium]